MHAGNDVDAGSEPFLDQGASNLVGYIERRGGDIDGHVARTNPLGVEELASRIDDCFELLTGGRRTALPRHQTLRATLDWSYQLLPELERVVLRRLAIFAGCFTLQAASAVAASAEVAVADIVDCAANLVGKSLVAADLGGATGWYRLLGTTRAYALEKLAESGELDAVACRHAEYHRGLAPT
jgi:predicted ATPase